MLPLSLDRSKSNMMTCCSTIICKGCAYANQKRDVEASLKNRCLFCRKPTAKTDEERDKYRRKRIEANDPVAMCQEGIRQHKKGDNRSAFEYFTKAAELGDVEAHHTLSITYHNGHGVENDSGRQIHHLELAAIGGHPGARHNLGCEEWNNDNNERAVKHWIIAANQGDDLSIEMLMRIFKERYVNKGFVSKDDLAATLRAHKAAVDETKSPQREAAEESY